MLLMVIFARHEAKGFFLYNTLIALPRYTLLLLLLLFYLRSRYVWQ